MLSVLRGEQTIAEAARREGVSQTSIANWRDQFLDGGQQAVSACETNEP
ncbi:MAG: transposase [Actinomycetes bacterium]